MSSDRNTRALQMSGMIRFLFVFLQGVILVKVGVPHAVIGLIELLFFLSEFSRYFILNGTKIAAFAWSDNERTSIKSRFYSIHLFAFISVLVLAGSYFFYSLDNDLSLNRFFLLAVFTFFMIIAEQYDWIFIEKKRSSYLIPYSIIVYGTQAAIVVVSIYYSSVNMMLGLVSVLLLLRSIHCHYILKEEEFLVQAIKVFALVALPIVMQALVNGIMPFIDLWVVEFSFDESTFLYYRYGARQFPIFMILLAGLRQGLMAKMKDDYTIAEKSVEIKAEIRKHSHLIFIPAIFLMLSSPLLYTLVYDANFIVSAFIFNIYLLILVFHILIIQIFFYMENYEWVLLRFSLIEALINLGLSIGFAQYFGLYGIVWATVIANVVMKTMQFLWLRKKFGLHLNELIPLKLYALYSIGLIISFVLAYFLYQ